MWLQSSRNTYIGDEGTRGVSRGEWCGVSIGVDIIHGPPLLFLDEPTSGLDSTSVPILWSKSYMTLQVLVLLWFSQSSNLRQESNSSLIYHLIILARGQLMFQGSPKDVTLHLGRMGRKVPKERARSSVSLMSYKSMISLNMGLKL